LCFFIIYFFYSVLRDICVLAAYIANKDIY